jgi:hypothetical protein
MTTSAPRFIFNIRLKPGDDNWRGVTNPEYIRNGIPAGNSSGIFGGQEAYDRLVEHYRKCLSAFQMQTPIELGGTFPTSIVSSIELVKNTGNAPGIQQVNAH